METGQEQHGLLTTTEKYGKCVRKQNRLW